MGVTGLWPLLEPVGRRINVEALSNKRLAIGKRERARMLGGVPQSALRFRAARTARRASRAGRLGLGWMADSLLHLPLKASAPPKSLSRPSRSRQKTACACPFTHAAPLLSLQDASIWVHQFIKAMRDERGEPLPNAHLIGFFRRICK